MECLVSNRFVAQKAKIPMWPSPKTHTTTNNLVLVVCWSTVRMPIEIKLARVHFVWINSITFTVWIIEIENMWTVECIFNANEGNWCWIAKANGRELYCSTGVIRVIPYMCARILYCYWAVPAAAATSSLYRARNIWKKRVCERFKANLHLQIIRAIAIIPLKDRSITIPLICSAHVRTNCRHYRCCCSGKSIVLFVCRFFAVLQPSMNLMANDWTPLMNKYIGPLRI